MTKAVKLELAALACGLAAAACSLAGAWVAAAGLAGLGFVVLNYVWAAEDAEE